MDTFIEIDDEMFSLLESYAGTETYDDRVIQLAGESMGSYDFTGLFYVEVAPLMEATLKSWDDVDAWLEELGGFLSEDVLPDNIPEDFDPYTESAIPPITIFGSLKSFKESALNKLGERLKQEKAGVACVEVRNNEQTLYLVYDDLDLWAFDFNDRIKVFRGDEFTEENGYYDL